MSCHIGWFGVAVTAFVTSSYVEPS